MTKTSLEPVFRAKKYWVFTIGGALAASIVGFWFVPLLVHRMHNSSITTHSTPAPHTAGVLFEPNPGEWKQVEKVVSTMTVDGGLYLVNDRTPARLVRQVETERMEWFDQQRGVRVETITPRENVQLIELETY